MIRYKPAAVVLLVLVAAGCGGGSGSKPTASVKGKITLDGKPLETGKIAFDGNDGTPSTILDIKAGAYEGAVPVGTKKVQITSYKLQAMPKTGMSGPEYEKQSEVNILPAKYNAESKETREVKAGGPNEFNFDLTSK